MSDILVKAVRSGSKRRIEAAQAKLDALAEKEARAGARARRLALAQDAVNKERSEQEARDRAAAADKAERELREAGRARACPAGRGRRGRHGRARLRP